MSYDLCLKYNEMMPLGIKGYWGHLCEETYADIMYWSENEITDEDVDEETDEDINEDVDEDVNEEVDEDGGIKIGTLVWATYNQALAMVHGVNITDVPYLLTQINSQPLFNLDYSLISQETINEIGAASNPNIVILRHFGISAAYRNKGLGEEVLKGFIEQMKGKCGYIVIPHSVPAQLGKYNRPYSIYLGQGVELDSLEKDPEKARYKLNAFWQRCGFKQFKNYENVFICNVDQAVPVKNINRYNSISQEL